MTIEEKIKRSKSNEPIDFINIGCDMQDDPLVPIKDSSKINVEPVWLLADDFEGQLYADYISEHPGYNQVYVRAGLLKKLHLAAKLLPPSLRLVVRAGHRT